MRQMAKELKDNNKQQQQQHTETITSQK